VSISDGIAKTKALAYRQCQTTKTRPAFSSWPAIPKVERAFLAAKTERANARHVVHAGGEIVALVKAYRLLSGIAQRVLMRAAASPDRHPAHGARATPFEDVDRDTTRVEVDQ
jgi:hypothetical protein